MTRRIAVQEPGDSDFLPGERVDQKVYSRHQPGAGEEGKQPAEGRPEIMGITKASLATDSWLSAASFQETTRVLTEAAIESQSDSLLGLKENIIIGKLIPAGTGMPAYRDIATSAPDYQPMEYYSSGDDDADLAEHGWPSAWPATWSPAPAIWPSGGERAARRQGHRTPSGRRLGLTHPVCAGRVLPGRRPIGVCRTGGERP